MGIEIIYKLDEKNKLKNNFDIKKLELSFPISKQTNYELDLDLWGEIVTETVKVLV